MPVMQIHLPQDGYTQEQCETLLVRCTQLYCEVLSSPIERVRTLINFHQPWTMATAGKPLSQGGAVAPYFDFIVLEGRPLDQIQALLAGFTDILVEVLGVERSLVRGACWPVTPEHWGIGGVPASVVRDQEIASRKT